MSFPFCPFLLPIPGDGGKEKGERVAVWCLVASCWVKLRQCPQSTSPSGHFKKLSQMRVFCLFFNLLLVIPEGAGALFYRPYKHNVAGFSFFFFKFFIRSNITVRCTALFCQQLCITSEKPQADGSLCFAAFVFFQETIVTILPPLTFKCYSNTKCTSMSQTV